MMERRQILDLAQLAPGESALLVTLVAVSGSSYRRPGAQVLLLPDGRHAGILSGGCLEAEIARKAPWLAREGAVLQRYSTQMDDVSEIPFGLGCGGQIDLLIEPTDTPEFAALLTALRASVDGSPRTVITVLPTSTSPL